MTTHKHEAIDEAHIQELRRRFGKAQQDLVAAETLMTQARTAVKETSQHLSELGINPEAPIEPQVKDLYDRSLSLLEEIEGKLNDARQFLHID